MADITISNLTKATPSGNNILPYSTGSSTLGVPVSAIFQSSGINVAIGTSTPFVQPGPSLHIKTVTGANLVLEKASGSGISFRDSSNQRALIQGILNSDGLSFHYGESSVEAMRINASGKIGIGTSNPVRPLDIEYTNVGGGIEEMGLRLFNKASSTNATGLLLSGSRAWGLQVEGSLGFPSGSLNFFDYTAGKSRVSFESNGNIKMNIPPGGFLDFSSNEIINNSISLANNAYIDFVNASGVLIVNGQSNTNGAVSLFLCGGTGAICLGSSVAQPGTLTFVNGNPPLYRFTNTLGYTATFSFCFLRTRNYA